MQKDNLIELYQDYIDDEGYVQRYNYDKGRYYNTGICLKGTKGNPGNPGRPGKDGLTPRINQDNGHWMIGDVDTGVTAGGTGGQLKTINGESLTGSGDLDIRPNWNQTDSEAKDYIKNKPTITNGTDGITPHIDSVTGNWFIGDTNTGVKASLASESAVSGGNTISAVTTGEKYTWNNKANIWRGSQADYDLLTPDDNTIYIITS